MSVHPEQMLLSAVLRTGEYQALAAHGITTDLFHVYTDEAQWLERFVNKHGKAPSKGSFRAKYPEFVIYAIDDVAHWCEEVRLEHVRNQMIFLLDDAMRLIDQEDLQGAQELLLTGITTVQLEAGGISKPYDVFKDWVETADNVEARVIRNRTTGFAGVPTGFRSLDQLTGGLQPGWMTIVGARLGKGKTWTTVKMATSAALQGHKVAYFSLEQSRHQISMRVHSFASKQLGKGTVFNSLDLGRGTGFDIRAYKDFLADLQDRVAGNFIIVDSVGGAVSPVTVANVIEREQPDIVFIDFISRMEGKGNSKDDWVNMGRVSGDLQTISQRFSTPLVVAAQINRMGAGKEPPDAEHLALADKIGQDADLLITMTQRSVHVMKMKIAKFRHGPSGIMWSCHFDPGLGIFEEVSSDRADEIVERDNEVD